MDFRFAKFSLHSERFQLGLSTDSISHKSDVSVSSNTCISLEKINYTTSNVSAEKLPDQVSHMYIKTT